MLTGSLNSSLRRLLPKPLTDHHGFHSLAPPPTPPQNPPVFPTIGAIGDADFAAVSAGPLDTSQKIAARARRASTVNKIMGLGSQEKQNGSAEVSVHPSLPRLKVPINRIRKPEKRRAMGSKTVVACENCR